MTISNKNILLFFFLFIVHSYAIGQITQSGNKVSINGKVYSTMVINGDTVILADLDTMSVSSPRSFSNNEEYRRYRKYKYFASKVYPYAKDAINILTKLEERTKNMKPSKRKKYIQSTYRQLEHNFKQQLKKLSRTQGKILIKMIEKETGMTFFDLIKKMRNGFTAFYWHQFGKLYGYDLKEGYIKGKDRAMDAVLMDFKFDKKESSLNAPILKKEIKK
ncbi:MAG TPA: DUF4294 domain-containing protein [Bacteroidetes bacterium]|nr:DUF4294 domain-containing protein [Bacteroidota bacterium]